MNYNQEAIIGDEIKLESHASTFLKCCIRQHCSVYADLQFEREETKVEPKSTEEGAEEEDSDKKDKRKRNEESLVQIDILQAPLLNCFVLLCQTYADQVQYITEHLKTRKTNEGDFDLVEELDKVAMVFDDS